MGKGLQHSSGRVIALGRLMLAMFFLGGILIDESQPARAPFSTYSILAIYIVFAAGVIIASWRNWWVDARLAGPAHAIDVTMFAVLVLLTENYTSPFFTLFVFVLLSAAIRWGWIVTALTATLLVLLYLLVGLLGVASGVPLQWQSFIVRTGQLVILALILIWFGANQRWAQLALRGGKMFGVPSLDQSASEAALRSAVSMTGAPSGLFLWRDEKAARFSGLALDEKGIRNAGITLEAGPEILDQGPFLYDIGRNHAVGKDREGNLHYFTASELIPSQASTKAKLTRGMVVPISVSEGDGLLFLERPPGLAIDHLELGSRIASEIAIHRQRRALIKAAEESAEARSRLILARDLHDSVVQFLAGAAFRLEAMKRSNASGRDVGDDLDELKQLMLQEQRELRSFIKSLRSGPFAAFDELVRDLKALAAHLSRQWDVQCEFSALPSELMIPTRLRLDAHQLTREAVANAVRHAAAKSVAIELAARSDSLLLEIINDGAEFPRRGRRIELPFSLKERVDEAGGSLDMSRGMGVTKITIALPVGTASA